MTGPGRPNRGVLHREQIGREAAGDTVLDHLAVCYPRIGRGDWHLRILAGEVFLDGRPAAPGQRLRAGQWLAWARPPWIEPEVPFCTAVLYEDEDLLAVAKPDGLPTLPGGGTFQDHTLLTIVRQRAPEASPMHRLGRSTTGVVLFARTASARSLVQAAFRSRRLRKTYRALCEGHPSAAVFDIDIPIGEVPHALLGTVHGASPAGRASRSRVRVLETREADSLVEVEIETGRPHQIRIHLAAVGHPLSGDPLYGPGGLPLPGSRALPGDPGYRLHALRLDLLHPRSGLPLSILCAPPPVLRTGGAPPGF